MPIRPTRHDPEAQYPSPYRGCKWVTSHFPGQMMALVHGSDGTLLGEFRIPERLATPAFERMLEAWLEAADPLPTKAATRAAHLKLA